MAQVVIKDGKFVVVDDDGKVLSTGFTDRANAERFMNLRESVIPSSTKEAYGPPKPDTYLGPPKPAGVSNEYRPADQNEYRAWEVGRDIRTRGQQEPPGWLRGTGMSVAQWRALLAGLGVQNMPSTPRDE